MNNDNFVDIPVLIGWIRIHCRRKGQSTINEEAPAFIDYAVDKTHGHRRCKVLSIKKNSILNILFIRNLVDTQTNTTKTRRCFHYGECLCILAVVRWTIPCDFVVWLCVCVQRLRDSYFFFCATIQQEEGNKITWKLTYVEGAVHPASFQLCVFFSLFIRSGIDAAVACCRRAWCHRENIRKKKSCMKTECWCLIMFVRKKQSCEEKHPK